MTENNSATWGIEPTTLAPTAFSIVMDLELSLVMRGVLSYRVIVLSDQNSKNGRTTLVTAIIYYRFLFSLNIIYVIEAFYRKFLNIHLPEISSEIAILN